MLDRLIAAKLPALSKHLADTGTDLVAITPQWFLSLFSQDLPSEVWPLPPSATHAPTCLPPHRLRQCSVSPVLQERSS